MSARGLDMFDRISALLVCEPFRPLLIVAEGGEAYGVDRPSQVGLTRETVRIVFPKSGYEFTLPMRSVVACDTRDTIAGKP